MSDHKIEEVVKSPFFTNAIILLITVVLCSVIVATVGCLLYALFVEKVSNEEIFKILTPMVNTIIGVMAGVLGGVQIGKNS